MAVLVLRDESPELLNIPRRSVTAAAPAPAAVFRADFLVRTISVVLYFPHPWAGEGPRMGTKKRRRQHRQGLSLLQEQRLRDRLIGRVPSVYWLSVQFVRVEDTDPDGVPIVYTYHDPRRFPPPADSTPMIVCRVCGIPTPVSGIDVSRRVCLDCHCGARPHAQDAWGPSPFAVVMAYIRCTGVKIRENTTK